MKMNSFGWLPVVTALQLTLSAGVMPSFAADAPKAEVSTGEEAKYTEAIEKRTADILAVLNLKDSAKVTVVHDAVMAQYRALRDWQTVNQTKLKELAKSKAEDAKATIDNIMASRKVLHDQFFAKLASVLTSEQVEAVKDKLTYNKVKVTYDSYCEIINTLKEEDKAKVLEFLKEARELAVDGTSSDEKTAIFQKYKGRINNYLSKQGYNVAQAYKDWGNKKSAKKSDDKAAEDVKISK